jgi:hypothetical protein
LRLITTIFKGAVNCNWKFFISISFTTTCFGPYGPSSSGIYTRHFLGAINTTTDPLSWRFSSLSMYVVQILLYPITPDDGLDLSRNMLWYYVVNKTHWNIVAKEGLLYYSLLLITNKGIHSLGVLLHLNEELCEGFNCIVDTQKLSKDS